MILSVPPLISLAKVLVGTASSRRRIGLVVELAFSWMQKLIFPLRYPNIVPVMVVEVVSDDEECLLELWRYFSDIA